MLKIIFLKNSIDELIKKLIQRDKILKKKIEDFNKMIPGTSKSILVKEFKRLTKINFNVRMPEVSKIILTKNKQETHLI